jgi:hypothetical protein
MSFAAMYASSRRLGDNGLNGLNQSLTPGKMPNGLNLISNRSQHRALSLFSRSRRQ